MVCGSVQCVCRCAHAAIGKHVVFGRVLRGYQEVIQKIAEFPVDQKDRPTKPITIANCGELVMRSEAKRSESKGEGQSTVIREKGSAD